MWLLVARAPRPDAPNWPGRRWLAAMDALAWPLIVAVVASSVHAGLIAVLAVWATVRLHRALFSNSRYFFATWLVAKVLGALLIAGITLQLVFAV